MRQMRAVDQPRKSIRLGPALWLFLWLLTGAVVGADNGPGRQQPDNQTVTEIFPSNADSSCDEEFENVANSLQPGDELVLHGGTYTQTCQRAITVNGTVAKPIIIRA